MTEWKRLSCTAKISTQHGTTTPHHRLQQKTGILSHLKFLNLKLQLKNYLYYKKYDPQMYMVTQREDIEPPSTPEGFTTAFPMPDHIAVKPSEEFGYQLVCLSPSESKILPDVEQKLTGQVMMSSNPRLTMFSLKPLPKRKYVHIQYIVSEPNLNQKRQSVLALEWNSEMGAALPEPAHTHREQGEPGTSARTPSVSLQHSTEEFYQSHLENDMIYQMEPGRTKGRVLIMNNGFCAGLDLRRVGSEMDANNMDSLWSELGFEVHLKNNLIASEMMTAIREFASLTTRVSCVVVILMSHGGMTDDGREFSLGEDDERVLLDDVISLFTSRNSPHLQGIPKLFMFQMCRGNLRERIDEPENTNSDRTAVMADAKGFDPDEIAPMRGVHAGRSDMLIAYPSQSGYVSYRDTEEGSWHMNAIANVFRKHAHDTHVLDMLTRVNFALGKKRGDEGNVQISNQECYLQKDLFLFPGWPSKDNEMNEAYTSDRSDDEEMKKSIRESLNAQVIRGELIGPEGGSINMLQCKAVYPPNAFQKETPVCHFIRSNYHNAPEGFVVCSPELGCTTFGVPFHKPVTITLPLHMVPDVGEVTIFKKSSHSSPWSPIDSFPINENDRVVTFQVTHFCIYKACCRFLMGWWKTFFCHYLFYKPATSQLCAVTCIDDRAVKEKCVATFIQDGFIKAHTLPDQVVLSNDERMSYRYECTEPAGCRLLPDGEVVLTRRDVVECSFRLVKLCPEPPQDTRSVTIQYLMKPPQGVERESMIALEWNTPAVVGGNGLAPVQEVNVVRCTREFYEHHRFDDENYRFDPNRPKGKVLIINNKFEGQGRHEIPSSEADVRNMEKLWADLGFDVVIKHNLTAEEMRLACQEFARDIGAVSSVFLLILSHGGSSNGEEFISGEDWSKVLTKDIISFFTVQNSPHLQGIPKVFMFEACRGNYCDRPRAELSVAALEIAPGSRADILIAYPCQSGFVSLCNEQRGSYVVNAITNIFMSRAHNTHVLDMLTMVNNAITIQTCSQENYLNKKLYLFPGWPN